MSTIRDAEIYGDVRLSVQASQFHYCQPREDGHDLSAYESVEIALLGNNSNPFLRPSDLDIQGFDHLFEDGVSPVAGYVPQATLQELRDALTARVASGGKSINLTCANCGEPFTEIYDRDFPAYCPECARTFGNGPDDSQLGDRFASDCLYEGLREEAIREARS